MTIAKRELTSLFFSPIAYLVLGVFAFGTTLMFFLNYGPGMPATMRGTFQGVVWLLIILIPGISMRLFSEEYRNGTIETLMTAPISDTQAVLGKWLGAMAFYACLLLPMVVLTVVLAATSRPDWGPILTGFLGMLLIGGLYMSIGAFASTITQNQIIAFIVAAMIIGMIAIATWFLSRSTYLSPMWRDVMLYLRVDSQADDFFKGIIDSSKVVYFVTGTAFFLFLSVKTLESRRWR